MAEHPEAIKLEVRDDVYIRPLTPDDIDSYANKADKNRDYLSKWIVWARGPDLRKVAHDFIYEGMAGAENNTSYLMGIFNHDQFVGAVDIRNIGSDEDEVEVGYWLSEDQQGQGLVTQSLERLIEFARSKYNIKRIVAHTFSDNDKSGAVLERLGFRLEAEVINPEHGAKEKLYVATYE